MEYKETIEACLKTGRYEEAAQILRRIEEEEKRLGLINDVAEELNRQEKYTITVEFLSKYGELGKDNGRWNYEMGCACYYDSNRMTGEERIKEMRRALEYFTRAVQLGFLAAGRYHAWCKEDLELLEKRSRFLRAIDEKDEFSSEINRIINPFQWTSYEGGFSVTLKADSYRKDLFSLRREEGFEGNGYDWASLAKVFVDEKKPALKGKIRLDPDIQMFVALSEEKEPLEEFILAFRKACDDRQLLESLFQKAEVDLYEIGY